MLKVDENVGRALIVEEKTRLLSHTLRAAPKRCTRR